MRRGVSKTFRRKASGLGGLGAAFFLWLSAGATAWGQIPQPTVPDINQRSGLLTRFVPIEPNLPPDSHRDSFYDTRYVDNPNVNVHHPNNVCRGGLYGLRWKGTCTQCYYPSFHGAPGRSTIGEQCAPWPRPLRFAQNILHPFKPVGSYYAGGCYVPLYDLDPVVPGPGPYPIPWYFRGPDGG